MARFQTEIENLQQQQKEAIDRLQTLEAEGTKLRELILKISGALEVLTSLSERDEQQEPQAVTPEVV